MNLRSIVDAKRKQTEQERKFFISSHVIKILRAINQGKIGLYKIHRQVADLEKDLERYALNIGVNWCEAWIKAMQKELGDPKQMAQDTLKQHAKPYWNPTKHRINVFPLGIVKSVLPDKSVEYETVIAPGEQVMVPWGHTIGGKHSSLKGIAPQLQPLPGLDLAEEHDEVMSVSFTEWCAFGDALVISHCCRKQVLWSVTHNKLICQKCQGDP